MQVRRRGQVGERVAGGLCRRVSWFDVPRCRDYLQMLQPEARGHHRPWDQTHRLRRLAHSYREIHLHLIYHPFHVKLTSCKCPFPLANLQYLTKMAKNQ